MYRNIITIGYNASIKSSYIHFKLKSIRKQQEKSQTSFLLRKNLQNWFYEINNIHIYANCIVFVL